ncbi:Uncharacterized protein TCM_018245 [Theobroma cacao]|uniref:Uncharacterized protein n=1 Tax=Theobroma cacao TaxID=3641 RepID=A0A061EFB9_THECC|nr:Uncharacterized protein TCM_018245 [Theobroma cacao]
MAGLWSMIYTWQEHGLICVARQPVDICGCDHLIFLMSTIIVETTIVVGIRWSGAPRCYYVEVGPHVGCYDYRLKSLESF